MLLRFTVENYRSIKDLVELDLRRANKFKANKLTENLLAIPGMDNEHVVNAMIIYGANAAGKSNLLKAVHALDKLVNSSMDYKLDEDIPEYDPFRLDPTSATKPTQFEIDFVAKDNKRYLYKVGFNRKKILRESLAVYIDGNKNRLYEREDNGNIKFGNTYRGQRIFNLYPNQLVLSQVSRTPNPILLPVYRFFRTYLYCSVFHDTQYDNAMIQIFTSLLDREDLKFRENLNKIVKAADTAIVEVITRDLPAADFQFPEELPKEEAERIISRFKRRVKTVHNIMDDNNNKVGIEEFDITEESTGTKKLLVAGGLIVEALDDGTTLIIDELDKSLHPLLTKMLVGLFSDPGLNPKGAQLILGTHDVSLLDPEVFRHDQILFSNKKYNGSSTYTRLSDFSGISKVANLDAQYLLGRFGGTPMINEFELDLEIEAV